MKISCEDLGNLKNISWHSNNGASKYRINPDFLFVLLGPHSL